MNPYVNRLMIQRPDDFFGREKEVARVLSRVGSSRPQSVSLVGERRIGKSSFLFHLTWPEVRQRYLEENERLDMVFFDLQQLRDLSPEDFLALLVTRIRAVEPEWPNPGKSAYTAFQGGLEWLSSRNKLLVLLFDEFDAITANPLFTREFYSFLRSLANNYPVAYVTSSRVELQILCHSAEIADSPFFNIFTNLYLKPFSRREAVELITVPSRLAGVCLEPYSDEIIDMAGFLPFYLQIACCACFDYLVENPGQPLALGVIESRFLEEASPHYDYLLSHLTEEQLAVLTGVAKGGHPGIEDQNMGRRLLRDGYLAEEDGGQGRIASRLLANYLLRRRPVKPVRREPTRNPEATSEIKLGSRLEQYEVLRRIGEGGMGYVYQAQDTTLNRKVALKLIKPELLDTESFRRRFVQEARMAAALSHPVITSVYELTEHEGQVVLVMEWLEGKTLKQLVQEEGRVAWRQLAQWMAETAGGLEAAHRQSIVHRDIKAANLFITLDQKVKILDFGLAKLLPASPVLLQSQYSSPGTLVGTIEYMSPEQACGQPVDSRSDLFSLGIVLFEALTGALPFRRQTLPATLYAIVNEPAPDLGLYDVEGAEKLEAILNRLLAKSPVRRYQSASHLEKDLRDLLKKRSFFWFR